MSTPSIEERLKNLEQEVVRLKLRVRTTPPKSNWICGS